MSSAATQQTHPTGLAAALAVVRLVMALLETLFADAAALPASHPDRRLHERVMAELARAEARILAEMAQSAAALARIPRRARTRPCAIARNATPASAVHALRPATPSARHAPRAPPVRRQYQPNFTLPAPGADGDDACTKRRRSRNSARSMPAR